MKVITVETMQAIDRRAIEEFAISGLALMEKAGRGCAEVIVRKFGAGQGQRAVIVAGKGNNGGDGFVVGRILREQGWQVAIFVLADRQSIAGDALVNLDRLMDSSVLFCRAQAELGHYVTVLKEATVIIDALFGTGLKSKVGGIYADAIDTINSTGTPVVAVDIPSGIDAGTGRVLGHAVKADLTVTFALAKLGHVLFPGADYTGQLEIVDIGIPCDVTDEAVGVEFLDAAAIKPLLRRRERSTYKGNYGHCLIVAGSTGKTGAAALAANSAMRAGAGLVTLAVPASLNAILEVKTTEAMTLPLPDNGEGQLAGSAAQSIIDALQGKDALGLGPGISRHAGTASLVRELVEKVDLPLVVDADGLNAIAEDITVLLRKKSAQFIITPHPGEMGRLAGITAAEVEADRIGMAREFATHYAVFLVLKGARTIIAAPDGRIAINGSGNPGMASGGMGDVLTGILTALVAQGYDSYTACKLGVFLHGFAADLVAAGSGENGMVATDVQESLPRALQQLMTV